MKFRTLALMGLAASALAAGSANAATVAVDIYNNFTDTGTGITFIGAPNVVTTLPVSSNGFSFDFNSGAIPGYTASTVFGADFTGDLSVASAGHYTLTFGTDDAGYLYVNGAQVGALPGTHPTEYASPTVYLNAGLNTFEIQYDNTECCGANVALSLPAGVTEVSGVPEPAAWAMMLIGIGGLGAVSRARRKADRGLATCA